MFLSKSETLDRTFNIIVTQNYRGTKI